MNARYPNEGLKSADDRAAGAAHMGSARRQLHSNWEIRSVCVAFDIVLAVGSIGSSIARTASLSCRSCRPTVWSPPGCAPISRHPDSAVISSKATISTRRLRRVCRKTRSPHVELASSGLPICYQITNSARGRTAAAPPRSGRRDEARSRPRHSGPRSARRPPGRLRSSAAAR